MPKLKLVHKVLVLVAVPLVFECLFVVVLENLWERTRQEMKYMDTLISKRSDEFKERREKFKEDVTNIHRLMAIGLGSGMIFSVVLLLSFSQNLFSRLRVLVENSDRFAHGKELLPPLGIEDEIGQLDRVFHEMTETIETTRARERDLLRMVSHDLRTPLNTVLATLETMSEGTYGELSEQGLARLKRAEAAVDRLIKLTNNLLDLEKLKAGYVELNLRTCSLQAIINIAVENVSSLAELKEVHIENRCQELFVLVDEERLVQVFINLLANAIKFSPESASIAVESRSLETNFAEVRITDQGPGVAVEEQKIIFEPFRQGTNSRLGTDSRHGTNSRLGTDCSNSTGDGSGIGLAISKKIVEAHGGSIGVLSKAGEGSTFWLRLRLSQAE